MSFPRGGGLRMVDLVSSLKGWCFTLLRGYFVKIIREIFSTEGVYSHQPIIF